MAILGKEYLYFSDIHTHFYVYHTIQYFMSASTNLEKVIYKEKQVYCSRKNAFARFASNQGKLGVGITDGLLALLNTVQASMVFQEFLKQFAIYNRRTV